MLAHMRPFIKFFLPCGPVYKVPGRGVNRGINDKINGFPKSEICIKLSFFQMKEHSQIHDQHVSDNG